MNTLQYESERLARLEVGILDLKKKILRKKRQFKEFDALPAAEKHRLDERGRNPHDTQKVRDRKKARYQEKLRKSIPPEHRKILEDNYGWLRPDKVIRRTCGSFSSLKS